jgi:glycosyltransferase involved in cell wall biosynthesis
MQADAAGPGGQPHKAVYFDITTSAHWSGRAVGIVRVERELARRGPRAVGPTFGYCVYNRSENVFHVLDRQDANDILAGRLQLNFSPPPPPPAPPPPPPPPTSLQKLRRGGRRILLRSRTAYTLLQKLRGRSFTPEQIDKILAGEHEVPPDYVPPFPDWRPPEEDDASKAPDAVRHAYLSDVSKGEVALTPSTTIISAGLDWEYKDIRAIYRLKKAQPFTYVAVLYDLIPILLPHFVVPAYVNLLTAYFGELFWTADACLAISQTTERDGLAYVADNLLRTPPRLTHFPLGSDLPTIAGDVSAEDEFPAALRGCEFALYVSTIEPRKNHRVLYQAWQVAIRNGAVDPTRQKLVFVGHAGWNVNELLHEMNTNPVTKGSMIQLHGVSDGLLDLLYKRASFCLLPSRYEGYGLTLAEGLRYGKPCLSSAAGALREVGGDLATYLDPDDTMAWSNAIAEWFSKPQLLRAAQDRITSAYRPVDWSEAARVFYARALQENRP